MSRPTRHVPSAAHARRLLQRVRPAGRLLDALVEHDLTEEKARPVRTRFELAIRRMMDGWLNAGRIHVSPKDVQMAREFLEEAGWKVEDAGDGRLRVSAQDGPAEEMSREAAVM